MCGENIYREKPSIKSRSYKSNNELAVSDCCSQSSYRVLSKSSRYALLICRHSLSTNYLLLRIVQLLAIEWQTYNNRGKPSSTLPQYLHKLYTPYTHTHTHISLSSYLNYYYYYYHYSSIYTNFKFNLIWHYIKKITFSFYYMQKSNFM